VRQCCSYDVTDLTQASDMHRNCKGMYRFASLRWPIGKESVWGGGAAPCPFSLQIGFDPECQTPDDAGALTEVSRPRDIRKTGSAAGLERLCASSIEWYVQSNGKQHAWRLTQEPGWIQRLSGDYLPRHPCSDRSALTTSQTPQLHHRRTRKSRGYDRLWRRLADLISRVSPTAILFTHAHADHGGGVAHGTSCPVYTPARTWRSLPAWPISERRVMPLHKSLPSPASALRRYQSNTPFPAVGYRVSANPVRFCYVPDVVRLRNGRRALRGVDLYVGDGASITRPIIRRRGRAVIAHSSIRAQLDWRKTEQTAVAYFTHCGSEIVTAHARTIHRAVRRLGAERSVDARVARDGLRLILGCGKVRSGASAAVVRGMAPRYSSCPSHARR
jgi:hypothetical protein